MNSFDAEFEDVTYNDEGSSCYPCNPCSPDHTNEDGSQCYPCNPCSPDRLGPGGSQCYPCNPCSPDRRDETGAQCYPCHPCSPDRYGSGGSQCYPCNPCTPDRGEPTAYSESNNDSGGCFITSACVESMNLPDNCDVLQTLRALRDKRKLYDLEFSNLVDEYYFIAPQIVTAINSRTDRKDIYRKIYETMVLPCVSMIKENRENDAVTLYSQTVLQLKKQYFENA